MRSLRWSSSLSRDTSSDPPTLIRIYNCLRKMMRNSRWMKCEYRGWDEKVRLVAWSDSSLNKYIFWWEDCKVGTDLNSMYNKRFC